MSNFVYLKSVLKSVSIDRIGILFDKWDIMRENIMKVFKAVENVR